MARGTQVSVAVTRVQLDLENTPVDGPWIQTSSREDLIHEFDHWEPEVQAVLQVGLYPLITCYLPETSLISVSSASRV